MHSLTHVHTWNQVCTRFIDSARRILPGLMWQCLFNNKEYVLLNHRPRNNKEVFRCALNTHSRNHSTAWRRTAYTVNFPVYGQAHLLELVSPSYISHFISLIKWYWEGFSIMIYFEFCRHNNTILTPPSSERSHQLSLLLCNSAVRCQ